MQDQTQDRYQTISPELAEEILKDSLGGRDLETENQRLKAENERAQKIVKLAPIFLISFLIAGWGLGKFGHLLNDQPEIQKIEQAQTEKQKQDEIAKEELREYMRMRGIMGEKEIKKGDGVK